MTQVGIGLMGALFAWGSRTTSPPSDVLLYLGCMLVVIAIVSLVSTPLAYRRAYTRHVRMHAMYTDQKELSFDEQTLRFSSPLYKGEIAWAAYNKRSEDESFLYLHSHYLGTVTMLPKRAFTAVGLDEFHRCSQSIPTS